MARPRLFLALFPGLVLMACAIRAIDAQVLQRSDVPFNSPTTLTLAKDSRLEIKNVNGEITLTRAAGAQAIVSVARDSGTVEPQIAMVTHDQGITICTVYPSSNPKNPTECLPGNKGRLAQGNPNGFPAVRFRVEIPDGVHVTGELTLGNIRSEGLTGNLQLKTARGDIAIVDGGSVTMQASVGLLGNIEAQISSVPGRSQPRRVRLEAIGSGQVRVALPTTLRVFYSITSQVKPTVDPVFRLEKPLGSLTTGRLGPAGESDVNLTVDTGIAGRLVLRRSPS